MRFRSFALLGACLLLCGPRFYGQAAQDEIPAANPGRPTVSTPATLTPVGYLQFENGGLYASDSQEFSTRASVNQVTKFTVLPRLQLLALTEPLVHSNADSKVDTRPGEVFAGVQGVILQGHDRTPTVSTSYIRRLYESPAPEIDIGTFRQSALLLISDDLFGFHFDVNGIATEQAEGTLRRGQFGQTLSISHSVARLTVSGELWHFTQPLVRGNSVGTLFAGAYPLKPNLVVDAGFNHGWTSTSTQWEGFVGFTYVLPHHFLKSGRSGSWRRRQ
jgi:hypothetical protein